MITNLLEAKRLVRKIKEFQEAGADLSLANKTAEGYQVLCRAVALRLSQVESMIVAGDFAQALQLSEQAPTLPDLLAILDFRKSEDWRALCKEKSLPCTEPFDAKAAEALNALYERGINADHPLYSRYREAMSSRDEPRAYQTLRAIVRLNPADTNAAAELSRLDVKVLAAQMAALDSNLNAGDTGAALERLRTIETAGFQTAPSGPVWTRAHSLRRDMWVQAAEVARRKGSFGDVFDWLERIRELQTSHKLPNSSDLIQRLSDLEKWAQDQHRQHLLDTEFRARQRELLIQLAANEEKDTAARGISTQELREDYEALNRTWRALIDFSRSLPEELTTRFKKRVGILKLHLQRRRLRKIALIGTATILILSITAGAAIWFLGLMNAKDLGQHLQALIKEREVRRVEQLLESTRKENPQQLARPDVRETLAKADKFLSEEIAKLQAFKSAFAEFPTQLQTNSPPVQIGEWHKKLTAVGESNRALAPVLTKETAADLAALGKRWSYFLEEEKSRRQAHYEALVKSYEEALAELSFEKPVEEVNRIAAAAMGPAEKAGTWSKDSGDLLKPRPDSVTRFENLVQRHKHYEKQMESLASNTSSLRSAEKLADYQTALDGLADCEFIRDARVPAARAMKGRILPPAVLTQVLLCGQNTNLWNQLKDGQMPPLMPSSVMPAEHRLSLILKNVETVATAVHKYEFSLSSKERRLWLSPNVIPDDPGPGWNPYTGTFLEPDMQAFPAYQKIDFGYFGKLWKLPDNQFFQWKHLGKAPEPQLFYQTELHKGIGEIGTSPRLPLVKVLDILHWDRSASPLFRAWLYLKVFAIMEIQPDGWGLPFAPLVQRQRQDLVAAGAGLIKEGDWYLDSVNRKLGPKLESALSAHESASYFRQADSLAKLYNGAVVNGFDFVGHISLDGTAQVNREALDELWGWDAEGKPAMLFRKLPTAWVLTTKTPVPFTPLFGLRVRRDSLLRNAEVDPKDPLVSGSLPLLFTFGKP